MKSINPATGKLLQEYNEDSIDDVAIKISKLHDSFHTWSKYSFAQRNEILNNVANILDSNKYDYVSIMINEMGKVKKQAISEIDKCAWVCRYFADNAEGFLKRETIPSDAKESYVDFLPLGVILGVMPWNFPFWQVLRFAAPTLMAGNTVLLKHASNVTGCAAAINALFAEASDNLQIFDYVKFKGSKTHQIIENPLVRAVSITGSTDAGKKVAAAAGSCIKKCVLELGGSDPFIVMPDADIQSAVDAGTVSRMISTGQNCIAAKRFIVHKKIYLEFISLLTTKFESLKIDYPNDPESDIGPLANSQILNTVARQVNDSVKSGATCLLGGDVITNMQGYYYQPTILTNIPKDCPAAKEEIFGPVASVFSFEDIEEAIEIANNTTYGLGAVIFSNNIEKAKLLAQNHIEAGSVFINTLTKSDPRLPFGGIKESGYGRELSVYGIKEFVNAKVIYIA